MIKKNEKESIGSLKISQEVITSIANMAAGEVEGVASIVDNGKIRDIFSKDIFNKDMFGIKKGLMPKSMRVDVSNDLAVIDVCIKVKHGCKIQIVSQNVQQKVKDAIQSMTGIAISKVNVHIVGIDFESDPENNSENNLENNSEDKFENFENQEVDDDNEETIRLNKDSDKNFEENPED